MSFRAAVSDLQLVGHDLARPECVVTTACGDLFVSDKRGGIMRLMPGGGQRLIAARGVDGFLPDGFSLLPDRSFAIANIGLAGGAWRLMPDGALTPEVVAIEGMVLPPTQLRPRRTAGGCAGALGFGQHPPCAARAGVPGRHRGRLHRAQARDGRAHRRRRSGLRKAAERFGRPA